MVRLLCVCVSFFCLVSLQAAVLISDIFSQGDKRKLQTEIDRTLKKVQEGVEVFDQIWEKVGARRIEVTRTDAFRWLSASPVLIFPASFGRLSH